MTLSWLLAMLVKMTFDPYDVGGGDGHVDGSPVVGDQQGVELPPGCLLGDSVEAIIIGLDGSLCIAPYHPD